MGAARLHRITRLALAMLSAFFVVAGVVGILGDGGAGAWLQLALGIVGLVITARDLPMR